MFRNRGKLQRKDEELDIVDEFNYLGIMFNYHSKFSKTQNQNRMEVLCFQYGQV